MSKYITEITTDINTVRLQQRSEKSLVFLKKEKKKKKHPMNENKRKQLKSEKRSGAEC